jgi:hypothetical protein
LRPHGNVDSALALGVEFDRAFDLRSAPAVTATGNQSAFGVHTTLDVFLKARFSDLQENTVRGALNFKF